jgi:hypothetical protein
VLLLCLLQHDAVIYNGIIILPEIVIAVTQGEERRETKISSLHGLTALYHVQGFGMN